MKFALQFAIALLLCGASVATAQEERFHRAEDDLEITYWMLPPETHQFRFSHDFTIERVGQKYAHSFVRKGSKVSPEIIFLNLDSGKRLETRVVTGKQVNELGYYPDKVEDDSKVVEGILEQPVAKGETVRIRVMETYTDEERYYVDKNGELVWDRTFGRMRNILTLPEGWMISSCSVPAIISEDEQGRIVLRLWNPRNDELHVIVHARKRPHKPSD